MQAIETSIELLILWELVERSKKPSQNNQSQEMVIDRVKADEDINEYLDSAVADPVNFQIYELQISLLAATSMSYILVSHEQLTEF